ncbi:hypothetical protein [Paenibacillus radicis (ex Gao et al. 2016)]|uniref:Uncharacterized protein n=1 Tax=Paenibacillus radicis (ex Gao et al. 2016) TaxID=1737354 RepID=A0A917GYS2_9BACL|nr:hypothetical protein [Paenibacillus radicis (ex Gao et al. 2016)]GGG61628.1 hypothetical protein GCM10010918_13970 [Paenibacillus radicis (ex Gao et al. 2016)]
MKWLLAIVFYHIVMIPVVIMTILLPFILYKDIKTILINEVPVSNGMDAVLAMFSFFIYLAVRSKFLGKPYRKITILLPLLQMLIYTNGALVIGIVILNKWANDGLYSKGWAIVFACLAIVAIRLLMSLFYRKFPIVQTDYR